MALNEAAKRRIETLIQGGDVVLFMKGNRMLPQCGFSARVVQMLDELLPGYETVDVLENPDVREGIKEYSSWPTIPQLYVRGEFVGGCDIITDLYMSGDLHRTLGVEAPERTVPNIHISAAAARRIHEYMEKAPGKALQLSIDAGFKTSLGLAPARGNEIQVEANGVTVLMDPATAQRAEGLSLDVTEGPTGAAFKIDNPNAPPAVKQVSASEVKKMIEDGVELGFFDARTPEERAIASIEGARLLDQEAMEYIGTLPKDATLVFHCHHGGRSQEAAENFRARGYRNVYNLVGGIDAWSREVDPDVPRY